MSGLFSKVMEATGALKEDVLRVATQGGTSQADWAIAYEIEAITGRPAADIMWAAQDRLPEPAEVAPTNPRAIHDPEVRVYPENTSPEDTNRIAPHHPGAHDEDNLDEHDDEVAAEHLAAQVHGDLAEILDDAVAAARLTTAWSTPAEGRRTLAQVLMTHPTPRIRAQLEAGLAAA